MIGWSSINKNEPLFCSMYFDVISISLYIFSSSLIIDVVYLEFLWSSTTQQNRWKKRFATFLPFLIIIINLWTTTAKNKNKFQNGFIQPSFIRSFHHYLLNHFTYKINGWSSSSSSSLYNNGLNLKKIIEWQWISSINRIFVFPFIIINDNETANKTTNFFQQKKNKNNHSCVHHNIVSINLICLSFQKLLDG